MVPAMAAAVHPRPHQLRRHHRQRLLSSLLHPVHKSRTGMNHKSRGAIYPPIIGAKRAPKNQINEPRIGTCLGVQLIPRVRGGRGRDREEEDGSADRLGQEEWGKRRRTKPNPARNWRRRRVEKRQSKTRYEIRTDQMCNLFKFWPEAHRIRIKKRLDFFFQLECRG